MTFSHVELFDSIKSTTHFVWLSGNKLRLDNNRAGGRVGEAEHVEPVCDHEWREITKTLIHLAWRTEGQSVWVARLTIDRKNVAKIDLERDEKRLMEVKGASGKLNRRRDALVIGAGVPHWRFVDPATGELELQHRTDIAKYPAWMNMDEAVKKFTSEFLNIVWIPTDTVFLRLVNQTWLPVSAPTLFPK